MTDLTIYLVQQEFADAVDFSYVLDIDNGATFKWFIDEIDLENHVYYYAKTRREELQKDDNNLCSVDSSVLCGLYEQVEVLHRNRELTEAIRNGNVVVSKNEYTIDELQDTNCEFWSEYGELVGAKNFAELFESDEDTDTIMLKNGKFRD